MIGAIFQSYARVMAVVAGVIAIAVGIYLVIGHPGTHGH